MAVRYRVALQGFSEFERTTLTFCFRHAALRAPAYEQVELIADSDFIVANATQRPIEGSQTRGERLRDTLFIGDSPPPGASMHIARPLDPERILRSLDKMAAQREASRRDALPDVALPLAAPEEPVAAGRQSATDETTPAAFEAHAVPIRFSPLQPVQTLGASVAISTADSEWPAALDATPSTAATDLPRPDHRRTAAERAAAKAAARRASRRARLAQSKVHTAGAPRDLLLYDGGPDTVALRMLLESFGFRIHRVTSGAQATAVLERVELAVAFLDFTPHDANDIDGLDLCRLIKRGLLAMAGPVPAVVLMSGQDSAVERVYAQLAGYDAFLTRPVTRGDAARALEGCNVALPADARRA